MSDLDLEDFTESNEISELPRLTLRTVWADVMSVLNLERGIFYTIWGLMARPKDIIDEYLFHNRKKGAHPVRFLLLTTTIAALASYQVITNTSGFSEGLALGAELASTDDENEESADTTYSPSNSDAEEETGETKEPKKKEIVIGNSGMKLTVDENDRINQEELSALIFEYMQSGINIFTLFSVPFLALITFLFYRKRKRHFAEHLVAAAYCTSFLNIWSLVSSGVQIFHVITGTFLALGAAFYVVYFVVSVYGKASVGGIFKAGFAYILWIMITGAIALASIALLIAWFANKMV